MDKTIYKTHLRPKGQVTVPQEIRNLLGAEEGDDLLFYTDEAGRVVVSRAQIVDPERAWFWSDRWQRMEREAQADLEAGNIVECADIANVLAAMDEIPADNDAEDLANRAPFKKFTRLLVAVQEKVKKELASWQRTPGIPHCR